MNPMQSTQISRSEQLFDRAKKVLPGGVSRYTIYRSPYPIYVSHGEGCRVVDLDGNVRIDFANNMASLIHGHAHPKIVAAVSEQLSKGTAFTLATEAEVLHAELMCDRVSSFDKICFMNSGTEAVMAAIKAARSFTGRPKIAKIEGSYHGTYDYAEVSQKSSPENWGQVESPASTPVSKGTPQGALDDVVVLPLNNVALALARLNQHADQIACVLLDPLPHRVGLIPASDEFVRAIRKWTRDNDALFVLDEVITFRMGYGGAADWFDEEFDLTAMGKIIGGGFPVGGLAGAGEVMSVLDPGQKKVPFPFSGTFSANPITMTAGRVAMELYDRAAVDRLNKLGEFARARLQEVIRSVGAAASVTGAGSMLRVHLKPTAPTDYRSAYTNEAETARIRFLVDYMFDHGFILMNTCSAALSTAMTESEIEALATTMGEGLVAEANRQ
jgi:glutamate-1-semialdehyde 2,1-aminomutase